MSLQRYGEYKDCRVAWLGKLPTHWAVVRVKHVTGSIEQGWSPQCEGFPVETPDEWGVMKVGCVNGGRFRPSENKKLPVELQPMPQYALKRGDLLISRANTRELVGSAAVVQDDLDNLLLCDKLYRLRANEGMNQAKYLAYFLGTREARSQIELDATGASSSMLNIGQSAILDLLMPWPSAAEQAAITTFLDRETAKNDALIADQEKLIALLAEKRQATISHAVTKGLNPDVPMKDSGVAWLGMVPAHWGVVRVKDVTRLESGHTPSKQFPEYWENCEIPWVSLNDSKFLAANDYISDTAVRINELGLANSSARMLPAGTVVFTRDATIGLASITTLPMAVSQHLIAWCPSGRITSLFLLRIFNAMKPHLDSYTFGATIKTIGMADVKKLVTTVPPLEEQIAITKFIESELVKLASLTENAQRAVALLKERRSALITAAVTGQIDVRHLVQGGPA